MRALRQLVTWSLLLSTIVGTMPAIAPTSEHAARSSTLADFRSAVDDDRSIWRTPRAMLAWMHAAARTHLASTLTTTARLRSRAMARAITPSTATDPGVALPLYRLFRVYRI